MGKSIITGNPEVKVIGESKIESYLKSLENAPGDPEREPKRLDEIDELIVYQDNVVKPFLPEKVEIGLKGRWQFKKLIIASISKNPFLYK